MIVFLSTSPNVGTFTESPLVPRIGLLRRLVVAAVTRSSIARVPPSTPARSMPWIDSDSATRFLPASGTVSSVTRRTKMSDFTRPRSVVGSPAECARPRGVNSKLPRLLPGKALSSSVPGVVESLSPSLPSSGQTSR